jgi:hypothetical protein
MHALLTLQSTEAWSRKTEAVVRNRSGGKDDMANKANGIVIRSDPVTAIATAAN